MKKLILPFFFVFALLGLVLLSNSFSDKSLHFFGIAGQREQTISFQYPVEIVQVFGVDGKKVKQDEMILEVKRHELDIDRTALDQEIRRFELQKQEANNANNSQLASLSAKKQAVSADMDYQIHVLELRLKINSNMLYSISDRKSGKSSYTNNTELKDLKRKRHYLIQAIQAEINHLTEKKNATIRPIDAQLSELLHRKDELIKQNISLKVGALFNGRIGSVNFKVGELVPPFQPIMSLHSQIPRYIKGYIHENILNDVKVGQTVFVRSLAFNKDQDPLIGSVESLGNRIVEYPQRLKKNPLVPAWGREVVVRLNDLNHSLLFGEKVEVLLQKTSQNTPEFQVINEATASTQDHSEHALSNLISSANPKINGKKIEASGILWQSEESHFLVISDEQYDDKSTVFIMNENGFVSARLTSKDPQKIDDLESISRDGDYIYVLSSLSHNKKGKLKTKRKKLMRFKYQGHTIVEQQSIDLYGALEAINKQQALTKVSLFLSQAINDQSIDIESHFITDDNLYLGFKTPFDSARRTLILKINTISALFENKVPDAEIWKTFNLLDSETGEPMQLSDMTKVDNYLFLLTVSRSSIKNSILWQYHLDTGKLKETHKFSGLKAEGITFNPEKSLFTVVFDESKNNHSKFQTFPYTLTSSQ